MYRLPYFTKKKKKVGTYYKIIKPINVNSAKNELQVEGEREGEREGGREGRTDGWVDGWMDG